MLKIKMFNMIKNQSKKILSMGLIDYFKHMLLCNRSDKQRIAKNTFWLFIAEIVNKGLMLVTTILIARYLGVSGYGEFSFYLAYVLLFAVIIDFGLNTLFVREVARKRRLIKKFISNISFLKIILSLFSMILIVIIAQFLGRGPEAKKLIYILGFYVLFRGFNEFLRSVFRSFEQMQYETYSKVVKGSLLLVFTALFIVLDFPIIYFAIGYLLSAFLNTIFTLYLVRKDFSEIELKISLRFIKKILKESWPFFVSAIFVIVYLKVTILMLSFFKGDTSVGYYSAVHNLIYNLQVLPVILFNAIFPFLSYTALRSKARFMKTYKKLFIISVASIPFFILIFLFAKSIIYILYGVDYTKSIIILRIMIWGELFAFFSVVYLFVLNAINKQKLYTLTVFLALVVNIILNFVLIPRYNYVGASISLVGTELFALVMLCFITNREIKKWNLPVRDVF